MKIKRLVAVLFSLGITSFATAQGKYFTKSGKITFFSKAPMEDIEASHNSAVAVLDAQNGALQFSVLMKGFEFEKALMQEHFNENYVESDKFPKAQFRGIISNSSDINYTKEGTYTARVKGQLTIHGITKEVETVGSLTVEEAKIKATSTFTILLSDYGIKIPALVKDNISNRVKITVTTILKPLK